MLDAKLPEIDIDSTAGSMLSDNAQHASRKSSFIVFAFLSAVFLVSFLYHPDDAPAQTLCGFKTIVGLPCPACGMTRSFCAAAKAEPARAFYFNLLGPPLFLFALSIWGLSLSACLNRPAPLAYVLDLIKRPRFIKPALSILLVYWGCRIVYALTVDGFAATVGQGLLFKVWQ